MEPEVTVFKCYDCCVKSKEEKTVKKTVTEIPKGYSSLADHKITYECSLGLSDCRNLRTFENCDITASRERELEEKRREDYFRPNKHVR